MCLEVGYWKTRSKRQCRRLRDEISITSDKVTNAQWSLSFSLPTTHFLLTRLLPKFVALLDVFGRGKYGEMGVLTFHWRLTCSVKVFNVDLIASKYGVKAARCWFMWSICLSPVLVQVIGWAESLSQYLEFFSSLYNNQLCHRLRVSSLVLTMSWSLRIPSFHFQQ